MKQGGEVRKVRSKDGWTLACVIEKLEWGGEIGNKSVICVMLNKRIEREVDQSRAYDFEAWRVIVVTNGSYIHMLRDVE